MQQAHEQIAYDACAISNIFSGDLILDTFVIEHIRGGETLMKFSNLKQVKAFDKKNHYERMTWLVVNKIKLDFFTTILTLFCPLTEITMHFKMSHTDTLRVVQRANQE
jgi:hypothetical protein